MECLYCIKPRHVVRKFHSHSGKSKYMQQASLLILMFMFFCISCDTQDSAVVNRKDNPSFYQHTYDWDTARKRIGLPLIEANLKLQSATDDCFTDPPADCAHFVAIDKEKKPRFDLKVVYWDSSEIMLERNFFVGPGDERLQIYYGYKTFEGWAHLGFGCSFRQNEPGGREITKVQADSVLAAWGLSIG